MSNDSILVSTAEGLGRLFYIIDPYKVKLTALLLIGSADSFFLQTSFQTTDEVPHYVSQVSN